MIKKINPKILLLIIVLIPFNQILWNYLFKIKFFNQISIITNDLIQATFVANLIAIILFSVIIFYLGGLNLTDFFIKKNKIQKGLKWVFIIWFGTQFFSFIYSLITQGQIEIIDNTNHKIGRLLGQIGGNALFEELIYRGLLLTQFFLILKDKWKSKYTLVLAIFFSQFLFAIIHIPNRLILHHTDYLFLDLIKIFIIGVIFSLIYIRTKNIILLIGIHTLINVPFSINKINFPLELIVLLLTLLILIFWNKLENKEDTNFWKLHPQLPQV